MKTVNWTARPVHLLGAAGFALLLGCTGEQQATAPPTLKARLNLSHSPDLNATVTSEITLYDEGGKVRRYKHAQKVKASFLGGIAHATAGSSVFRDARATVISDTMISTDETIILTPVVALLAGQLALDYDSTTTDDYGNQVRIVGTGPLDGSPVNEVWGYVNGQLVSYKRSSWSAATGGYVLTDQTLSGYSGGSLTGQVVSKVGSSDILFTSNESFRARLAALPARALTRVACWLAPQVAYASGVACLYTGTMFAGATVGLGIATAAAPLTGGLSVTAYLLGWAGWTDSMYNFLSCLNGRSRGGGGGKTGALPRPT